MIFGYNEYVGRGRGQGTDARTVLLGGKKIGRAEFTEYVEGDMRIKTFVDSEGLPIIRNNENEPAVIIEKNIKTGRMFKVFIYKADLEHDPIGDSVIRKTVETTPEGVSESFYYYSDNKQLLIRNEADKDIPVKVLDLADGKIRESFQWKEGDNVIGKEIDTTSETVLTVNLLNGAKHNLNDLPAVQKHRNGVLFEEEHWHNGNPESVDDKPYMINYWEDGKIQSKIWVNEKREKHRVGEPALIDYWQDGSRNRAEFYENGVRTRPGIVYESSTFFE